MAHYPYTLACLSSNEWTNARKYSNVLHNLSWTCDVTLVVGFFARERPSLYLHTITGSVFTSYLAIFCGAAGGSKVLRFRFSPVTCAFSRYHLYIRAHCQ